MLSAETTRRIDAVVAGLLILISVTGTILNLFSFLFFKNQRPRNTTSAYFKRVYLAITLTDTLICAVLFPVVEAALAPDRRGHLFLQDVFCNMWAVIWWILPQCSVLLVGLLSVSRLLVLVRPAVRLPRSLPWLLPLIFTVTILIVYSGGVLAGVLFPQYFPDWLYCAVLSVPLQDQEHYVTIREWNSGLLLLSVASLVPALSLFVISTSFFTSLYVLHKQSTASLSIGGSATKQKKATKTVFIMTFLYMVFNTPSTLALLMMLSKVTASSQFQRMNVEEYLLRYIRSSSSPTSLSGYTFLLLSLIPISLNSASNPAVYFCRMTEFSRHVRSMIRRIPAQVQDKEIYPVRKRTVELTSTNGNTITTVSQP